MKAIKKKLEYLSGIRIGSNSYQMTLAFPKTDKQSFIETYHEQLSSLTKSEKLKLDSNIIDIHWVLNHTTVVYSLTGDVDQSIAKLSFEEKVDHFLDW